jgi:hypothetical protein
MVKYHITLTAEERTALEQLVSIGKSPARKLTHARILLLADTAGQSLTDLEIEEILGTSMHTIERVRHRCVTEGLGAALDHRPQPLRPDKVKIKGDVEQQLIRLACSDPPEGRCRWTLSLLGDELVVLGLLPSVSRETVRQALKKNDIKPWIIEVWCIPPEANAEYVWRMEDVITIYQMPYDAQYPVVCFDEACKQLFGEVREPLPLEPGQPRRQDYEYERKGICHQLMLCEPLTGWRHARVTERRTRKDYAECLRELVDVYFPGALKIRLVQDNLNTHDGASLYEAFAPEEARRILERLEFHYIPKHGSWLNLAESEISIMNRQCLGGRLESVEEVAQQVAPWEEKRNALQVRVHWQFTVAAARKKLEKVYPSIEG